MTKDEALRRLRTVRTEMTTLVPRLTPMFARNVQAAITHLDFVIDAIVYDQLNVEVNNERNG